MDALLLRVSEDTCAVGSGGAAIRDVVESAETASGAAGSSADGALPLFSRGLDAARPIVGANLLGAVAVVVAGACVVASRWRGRLVFVRSASATAWGVPARFVVCGAATAGRCFHTTAAAAGCTF